jgi:hypothetical protein
MQRPGQEALTREVTKDVIAEARFGRPLCSPPATEIRSVAGELRYGLKLGVPLPVVCHCTILSEIGLWCLITFWQALKRE